ncbi:MAG: hypothetical protein AAGA17_01280 [Actinomycetota bacterium]
MAPVSSRLPPVARRARVIGAVLVVLVFLSACGGGGDSDPDAAEGLEGEQLVQPPPSGPPTDPLPEGGEVVAGDVGPPLRSAGGRATVTLSDGRVFELDGVRCGLSPEATGRDSVLFNAARVEESPYLDVSRLDVGSGPIDSVNLYITDDFVTYDLYLEASSLLGNDATFLDLTEEDELIRADAVFFEGDSQGFTNPGDEGIGGTIEVRC